jgi:hypothetical protein
MNPDLAITIIFGAWVALIASAVTFLAWRAAVVSNDPDGADKLKGVLAADRRGVQPR